MTLNLLRDPYPPGVVLDKNKDPFLTVVPYTKQSPFLTVALSSKVIGRVWLEKPTNIYREGHVLGLRFVGTTAGFPTLSWTTNPSFKQPWSASKTRRATFGPWWEAVPRNTSSSTGQLKPDVSPADAFKPVIYATAIEKASYSPATIIVDNDRPISIKTPTGEALWKPKNADGKYRGPISMRWALEKSINKCSIKILMDLNFDPVIEMARRMGITSPLGRNLSLSLGTSELSLYELTSAYTVFPNSGIYLKPTFVKRIEDRMGTVIEDNTKDVDVDESTVPKPTPRPELDLSTQPDSARRGRRIRPGRP